MASDPTQQAIKWLQGRLGEATEALLHIGFAEVAGWSDQMGRYSPRTVIQKIATRNASEQNGEEQ